MKVGRVLSLLCFVLLLAYLQSRAQTAPLPPNAAQVANLIGIAPQVEELRRVSQLRIEHNGTIGMQEVALRQDVYTATLAASLDVDSVLAEIDNERAQLSELRTGLQSKRNRALNVTTIGNIIAGAGSSVIGTAMQLDDSTAILGDKIGVASGAASTALQIYSLRQQRGGAVAVGRVPNMLARFFDRQPALHSTYPDEVWQYLNTSPTTNSQQTRAQALFSEWIKAGRIGPPESPGAQDKINQLTSSMGERAKLSINALTDRNAMLSDVRGRVALMKRDLADLLRSIR
jgi:hypothetical protein